MGPSCGGFTCNFAPFRLLPTIQDTRSARACPNSGVSTPAATFRVGVGVASVEAVALGPTPAAPAIPFASVEVRESELPPCACLSDSTELASAAASSALAAALAAVAAAAGTLTGAGGSSNPPARPAGRAAAPTATGPAESSACGSADAPLETPAAPAAAELAAAITVCKVAPPSLAESPDTEVEAVSSLLPTAGKVVVFAAESVRPADSITVPAAPARALGRRPPATSGISLAPFAADALSIAAASTAVCAPPAAAAPGRPQRGSWRGRCGIEHGVRAQRRLTLRTRNGGAPPAVGSHCGGAGYRIGDGAAGCGRAERSCAARCLDLGCLCPERRRVAPGWRTVARRHRVARRPHVWPVSSRPPSSCWPPRWRRPRCRRPADWLSRRRPSPRLPGAAKDCRASARIRRSVHRHEPCRRLGGGPILPPRC